MVRIFMNQTLIRKSTFHQRVTVQLNKYETDPYFLQIFQSNMSVCLIISVFCKSCEPICEPEITPVLYHLENLQKSKQKQFHIQCSVHKSYKTRKWTLLCIGIFEENMDNSSFQTLKGMFKKTITLPRQAMLYFQDEVAAFSEKACKVSHY